jgi:hypothetical protein
MDQCKLGHWLVGRSEREVCNMGNEVLLTMESHNYMPPFRESMILKREIPKFLWKCCGSLFCLPHNATYSIKSQPMFQRNKLPPSLGLKNEPGKKPAWSIYLVPAAYWFLAWLILQHYDGGYMFLWNTGWLLKDCMILYPRREDSSIVSLFTRIPLCKTQI